MQFFMQTSIDPFRTTETNMEPDITLDAQVNKTLITAIENFKRRAMEIASGMSTSEKLRFTAEIADITNELRGTIGENMGPVLGWTNPEKDFGFSEKEVDLNGPPTDRTPMLETLPEEKILELMQKNIYELNTNGQTSPMILFGELKYIGDLLINTREDLLIIDQATEQGINEFDSALKNMKLQIGMAKGKDLEAKFKEWRRKAVSKSYHSEK